MVVGVCRLRFAIDDATSLKDKRAVVRSILDRTSGRFNVAAAEVDEQDVHQRAVLGFAVVSEGARHANEMIDRVVSFVSSQGLAPIIGRDMRLVHMGERSAEPATFGSWAAFDDEDVP